ncbi:MAG: siroheme synthase [Altererythrobacter sp.]|nr:siroheme synthase [Altererythrobacter sp.]MBT8431407.1 siroheme synthase [Altererythrobacter sp.]NNE49180.1 siroheme synthase [Altererythrobacter sp.]NNF94441.1 siroheme synthase [Altererythrobacter sp.]NNK45165.1 siroheme synthase [Altererythrobacter sp.]
MINSLPLFHCIKGQKVLVLGGGDAAEPKIRLIERAGGIIEDDMQRAKDEGVRLAFVAYEDAEACKAAAINLRCAGMLVNVVDMPKLCDFTTPSILDRDPVLIAIGTGGASAGLAKHVRLRLDQLLPQTLGALANALFGARGRLRSKFPDGTDRRRAIDTALREGGELDPFDAASAENVDDWLESRSVAPDGSTYTIQLTSNDPEDLTLKQARLLGVADIIVLDGEISDSVLARARADAQRILSDQASDYYPGQAVVRLISWAHAA